MVRSDSCRSTSPATAVRSAPGSTVPVSRSAPVTVYSTPPGVKFSRNHRRSWVKESGSRPSRGAGVTAASAASSRASISAARRATVGWSKRARGVRWVRSAVRMREVTLRLVIESPPSAKKSSCAPIRPAPSTSLHRAASACSVGVAGAVYASASPVRTGAGRARRSTLPLTVRGIASTTVKAAGTMYSGRLPARWARSPPVRSAAPATSWSRTTYAARYLVPGRSSRARTQLWVTAGWARSAVSISAVSMR